MHCQVVSHRFPSNVHRLRRKALLFQTADQLRPELMLKWKSKSAQWLSTSSGRFSSVVLDVWAVYRLQTTQRRWKDQGLLTWSSSWWTTRATETLVTTAQTSTLLCWTVWQQRASNWKTTTCSPSARPLEVNSWRDGESFPPLYITVLMQFIDPY